MKPRVVVTIGLCHIILICLCLQLYVASPLSAGSPKIISNQPPTAAPLSKDLLKPDQKGLSHTEIIVKFQNSSKIAPIVQEMFEKGQEFESKTGSGYIDQLNSKYTLIKVTKIFKNNMNSDELAKKFPKRAKRRMKNAKNTSLGHAYKFIFAEPHNDIKSICKEYEQDQNIQYAHPSYRSKTHIK